MDEEYILGKFRLYLRELHIKLVLCDLDGLVYAADRLSDDLNALYWSFVTFT